LPSRIIRRLVLADDGTILARSPSAQTVAEKDRTLSTIRQQMRDHPDAGSVAYVSPIDGVRRRGSYQHLSHFPLTALVSQSERDVQSSWRAELRSHAIILLFAMVVVVVLGGRTVATGRLLATQARPDGLTGLGNRRSFDETLEREVRRAARSGQPLSLVMIDIDHFKDYNDCYGHPAGDECLRVVARTIQGCLRRTGDVAARHGGEEIAVLLPGADATSAFALAETMRQAVRSLAVQQAHQLGGVVTFSAGVGTCVPGRTASEAQALVEVADTALFAAKAAGRNRVKS
jgi:diguanylate cyclase (GGDEF)-like protein